MIWTISFKDGPQDGLRQDHDLGFNMPKFAFVDGDRTVPNGIYLMDKAAFDAEASACFVSYRWRPARISFKPDGSMEFDLRKEMPRD